MNGKELMDKVYDNKCADELSAEELLSRSRSGAKLRRSYGGIIAAAAAVAVAGGAAAFVLANREDKNLAAEPLTSAEPAASVTETATAPTYSESTPETVPGRVTETTPEEVPESVGVSYIDPETGEAKPDASEGSIMVITSEVYSADAPTIDIGLENYTHTEYSYDPNRDNDLLERLVDGEWQEVPRLDRQTEWGCEFAYSAELTLGLDPRDWGGFSEGEYRYTFELSKKGQEADAGKAKLSIGFTVVSPESVKDAVTAEVVGGSIRKGEKATLVIRNNTEKSFWVTPHEDGCELAFKKGQLWVRKLMQPDLAFTCDISLLSPGAELTFDIDPSLWQETTEGQYCINVYCREALDERDPTATLYYSWVYAGAIPKAVFTIE
ncbi:MAG: hypothetical protein IKP95_00200 [Ruminococcus sp.]|nr:hypothetical protein [Ruminococcus sp.]